MMIDRRLRTVLIPVLGFLLLFSALWAEPMALGGFGSFIDLPEGWTLIGQEPEKLTFAYGEEKAFLQMKRSPGAAGLDALVAETEKSIGARGEGTRFEYGGGDAYFGTVDFTTGEFEFSGYLFAYHSRWIDPVVVLGFSDYSSLGIYNDLILSAIDSYSPVSRTNGLPGPVGAFDRVFSKGKPTVIRVRLDGAQLSFELDDGEVETASYVTEREARVLSTAGTVTAWSRFFRILYRDSLSGISPLIEELHRVYPEKPRNDDVRRIAEDLLAWLQEFSYRRTGTFSDFIDPIQAVVTSSGDCDSLGLLYVMLLHSFDIDAILLVSQEYSHALGAVDAPGDGARFSLDGTAYLIAELTETVDLGLIAADMADPAGWTPVKIPDHLKPHKE